MKRVPIIIFALLAGLGCLGGAWWLGFQRGVDEAVRVDGALDWQTHLRTAEIALALQAGDEEGARIKRREVLIAVLHELAQAAPNSVGTCKESDRRVLLEASKLVEGYPRRDQLDPGLMFCDIIAAHQRDWIGEAAGKRAAAQSP